MAFSWLRSSGTIVSSGGKADMLLASVPLGKTLIRTIFGWSAYVEVAMWQYELIVGRLVFAGVDTVRSGYGGTLPHPGNSPLTELSYPGERWLWYSAEQLLCDGGLNWRYPGTHITMRTVGTLAPVECETAVLNTYAAQTLDVHLAVESTALAALGLEFTVSGYLSALVTA